MGNPIGLNGNQQFIKRIFDVQISFIGLCLMCIPDLFLTVFAIFSTRKFGVVSQLGVGKNTQLISIYKIISITGDDQELTISAQFKIRITSFGYFLRKLNLDDLPQLFHVFIGNMSLVGPWPDLLGYADKLVGDDRVIWSVRPRIIGQQL